MKEATIKYPALVTIVTMCNKLQSDVFMGKQEFRRTDFGSRLLAAEGERRGGSEGERCV